MFKGKAIGVKDAHGKMIKEGMTLRWMAEDGDCFQGKVEYKEYDHEQSPILAGFGVFEPKNITDQCYDDDCNWLSKDWQGELEIVKV